MKKINVLDCTLRDGGYYNNWNFNLDMIKNYLRFIKSVNIKFVEIGFFTIKKNNNLGLTANIDKKFFKKFKMPNDISFGVMINASELINSSNSDISKRFKDFDFKKVEFIRIACHLNEIKKIKKYLIFLKKKKIIIFINLMQASEIKKKHLKYIQKYLHKYINYIYFADSFGSLQKKNIQKLTNLFINTLEIPLGIHAHNNLDLALENTICAVKNGARWVDGTILGMGRGPGNTKTEDLLENIKKNTIFKKSKEYKKLHSIFVNLKKKYKWGPNKYYNFSARGKIHPTYVQMLASDIRIKKSNFINILKSINKYKLKKFDPLELSSAIFFNKKKFSNLKNINRIFFKSYKNHLIINSRISKDQKFNRKIMDLLKNKDILKIVINYPENKLIKKFADVLATCHPIRLMTLQNYRNLNFKKLLLPYSNMLHSMKPNINKKKIIDYPIVIKDKIIIKKNYLIVPSSLSLVYVICFLISCSIKNIGLFGFEGYKKSEPFQDQTQQIINKIKKKFRKIKFTHYLNHN